MFSARAAAWVGQAQGFGAKDCIVLAAFVELWRVIHDKGKILP
jgi:hypothetical protein